MSMYEIMKTPIEFEIDEIGICVCRDGKQKGSMLPFYKTRIDALNDQNRMMVIEFGTLALALQWASMNHQMLRTIHANLN